MRAFSTSLPRSFLPHVLALPALDVVDTVDDALHESGLGVGVGGHVVWMGGGKLAFQGGVIGGGVGVGDQCVAQEAFLAAGPAFVRHDMLNPGRCRKSRPRIPVSTGA